MARARKTKESGEPALGETTTAVEVDTAPEAPAANTTEGVKDKSTAAYWKRILEGHPELVDEQGSNQKLEQLWLADHPGQTAMPKTIRQNLANIKSTIRRKRREEEEEKASARRKENKAANGVGGRPSARRSYEALELELDECLAQARVIDKDGLEKVIQHLRAARNELIRKQAP
jgi:hypothetical protein